mgnify:CR=1 FL=1
MTRRQWPVKFTISEMMKGVPWFTVVESRVPKKYPVILAIVSVNPLRMKPFSERETYGGKYRVPKYEAYYDYGLWVPSHGMRTVAKVIERIENRSLSTNCLLIPGTGEITTLVVQN